MKFRLPSKKSKIINLNPLHPEQKKKSYKKVLIASATVLVLCIVVAQTLITMEYINTHSFHFQSPILFQTPLVVKRVPVMIQNPQGSTESGQIKPSKPLSVKELLKQKVAKIFGAEQWIAMDYVVSHESNYNLLAINSESGACGIMQALPCSKLLNKCPNMTDADCQTSQLIDYVAQRYGTPENAMISEIKNNWY